MNKYLKILLIIVCLFTFNVNALELNINSKNAILYNMDSNEVLYEKNENEKVQIASLTKIMTAIITLDKIDDLDKQVIIKSEDLKGLNEKNLVTAGFTIGEVVTYRDLLYALLLPSGADAATSLARNISKSEEEFVKLMNDKVKELKLTNTNFSNPIGLDDENNYSTAKEMSIIFSYALKNEKFKEIITKGEYTSSDGKLTFKSTIKKNASKYNIDVSYILGGKTGTTDNAGLCLATIANSNDVNYMLITTGAIYDKKSPHHIEDAKIIYDYFISNYSNQKIVDKNNSFKTLKTKYAKEKEVKLYPSKDVIKYLPNDYKKEDVKYVYNGEEVVTPFTKGKLGTLKIYYKDKLINTQKIYLNKKISLSIIEVIKENIIIILVIFILLIILLKRFVL